MIILWYEGDVLLKRWRSTFDVFKSCDMFGEGLRLGSWLPEHIGCSKVEQVAPPSPHPAHALASPTTEKV